MQTSQLFKNEEIVQVWSKLYMFGVNCKYVEQVACGVHVIKWRVRACYHVHHTRSLRRR